ncbi:hypothetical protein AAZX31_05G081700 [Glycine max]
MVRWRTDNFKVDGEQREQESLDGEEDREKEKTTQRIRNIPRYGGEGEEAQTYDNARMRRTRCSSLDKTMVRWRTDIFKVHGEQREQESLDVEEDNEKEKTARRRRNIPRYGGEGEEAETCDDARVRRTRCSDADRDLQGRRRLEEEESAKA